MIKNRTRVFILAAGWAMVVPVFAHGQIGGGPIGGGSPNTISANEARAEYIEQLKNMPQYAKIPAWNQPSFINHALGRYDAEFANKFYSSPQVSGMSVNDWQIAKEGLGRYDAYIADALRHHGSINQADTAAAQAALQAVLEPTVQKFRQEGDDTDAQKLADIFQGLKVPRLHPPVNPDAPPIPFPNGVPTGCNGADCLPQLNDSIAADPENVAALDARGKIYSDLGQMASANADALQALQVNPSDPAAFALYELTAGRPDGRGGNPPGQMVGGGTVDRSGSLGGSRGSSPSSLSELAFANSNPAASSAIQGARDAMRLGDMQTAMTQIGRALAADPNSAEAYSLRAMAYAKQGKYAEALRDVEAGLALSPKDATLLTTKAYIKNRSKDYRGALEAAGRARELAPNSADALANYAYALGGLGRRDEMLSLLEQAAHMDPRYAASLASAKNMPPGSDILFLFPGESAAGGSAQPSGPKETNRSSRARRYGVLAIATVLGGILVALGLLQSVAGPLTKRIQNAFTDARASAGGPAPVAPRPPDVPDGELLRGQYQILRQIGSGGMGLVFEGRDVSLNRPVAVKKMRDELRLDRRERMRFINEAKTVAALHHPNIVDIYAVIEESDELFLVFEFVNGHTIYDIISHRGALGFQEALGITRGMVTALDYAHGRGIIHRDLKPSNVMVNKEGFIKVMDFGIARMAKDAATRVSMTNTVVGTPPYMAPEQEQGVVRKEADVYSLAICVYEMLCGRVAFAGTGAGMLMNKVNMSYVPISKGVSGLPQGIDLVFACAFQADPDRRFHSAGELLSALEALPAALRA